MEKERKRIRNDPSHGIPLVVIAHPAGICDPKFDIQRLYQSGKKVIQTKGLRILKQEADQSPPAQEPLPVPCIAWLLRSRKYP